MIGVKEENMYQSVSANHEIHSWISYTPGPIRMIFYFQGQERNEKSEDWL